MNLDLAFTSTATVFPAAQLYIGVQAPRSGLLYWDPAAGFVPRVVPAYTGPLPTFGRSPLIRVPDVSVLVPGVYIWFVVVDRQADALFIPEVADFVVTVIE